MVSSQDKPHNYPFYSFHSDLYSFILYNDDGIDAHVIQEENDIDKKHENQTLIVKQHTEIEPFWNMRFDGPCSKEGSWAGV